MDQTVPRSFPPGPGDAEAYPEGGLYAADDRLIDVRGVQTMGMRPIWLKHRLVLRNWPAVETAVPVIDSLDALLDIEKLLRG